MGQRRSRAAIRDMNDADASHHLEQFAGDMRARTDAGRRHVDPVRIGPSVGDELRDRCGGHRWVYHHDERRTHDAGDWRDITSKVEAQLFVERCIDGTWWMDREQRVAIRRRTDDGFGTDIGTSPGPVFDDEWLAEMVGEPLPDQSRDQIGIAAGRERNDDVYRLARIRLRLGPFGKGGQDDHGRSHLQNLTSPKSHLTLPDQT